MSEDEKHRNLLPRQGGSRSGHTGQDNTLERLSASELRYRRLFETAQDGILLLDAQTGEISDANPFLVNLLGYPLEELLGKKLWEIGLFAEREASRAAFERLRRERYIRYEDLPLQTAGGKTTQVEFVSNTYSVGGTDVIQCNIRDVSERKRLETATREISQKVQGLHAAAYRLETCGKEEEACQLAIEAAERILSFPICSVAVVAEDELVVKATSPGAASATGRRTSLGERRFEVETLLAGRTLVFDGSKEASRRPVTDPSLESAICAPIGNLGAVLAGSKTQHGFSEDDARLLELLARYAGEAIKRIRLQEELNRKAVRDPLTDVYNRRYFTEVITQELARSKRHSRPIGFLMVDVDRFKEINDRLGHQAGDQILREAALLLQRQIRREDFVVRYGGDEFLVVLPETDGEIGTVKQRTLRAISQWNAANTMLPFPLTLSIGEAQWTPDDPRPIEHVLSEADRRMYEEKRTRSGT